VGRRRLFLLWTALVATSPRLAFGREPARESRRLELIWSQGDASCVSAAALVRAVEGTLGRAVFRGDGTTIAEVSGEVSAASPHSYAAHVVLRLSDGRVVAERTLLTREGCHRLDESIAVVVALMVDELERQIARGGTVPRPLELSLPRRGQAAFLHAEPPRLALAPPFAPVDASSLPAASPDATRPILLETRPISPTMRLRRSADPDVERLPAAVAPPEPSPASSPPPPPIAPPVAPPARPPAPEETPSRAPTRPSAPLPYAFAAGASVTGVLFPNVTFGAVARADLDVLRFLALSLALRSFGPATVTPQDGSGGRFWGWSAEGALCPFFGSRRVAIGGCAGVAAGTMTGSAINLAASQSLVHPLVLATVAPELRVRLAGPFWLRAEAGLLVPLAKEQWQLKLEQTQTYVQVLAIANAAPFAAISVEFRSGS
jgi:hypothetical protein